MTVPAGTEDLAKLMAPVAERFAVAGHRLYLVGGVVRDLVLADRVGVPFELAGNDIDMTTDAGPDVIKGLVGPLANALWTQGERFGTIGATVAGQAVEITTHRAESYDPASRKPIVTFGTELSDDLSRRDFTINAAAIELPAGESAQPVLHDPYGGLADLDARVLRTPLSPEISFTDDPLRMMRAARFISRFRMTSSAELVSAATELSGRLAIVSVERVTDELERLLALDDPSAGLEFLVETGLFSQVLPAYAGRASLTTEAVGLAATPAGTNRSLARRAGLLWPVRDQAAAQLRRLKYSRADTSATRAVIEGVAMAKAMSDQKSTEAVGRRIVALVGLDRVGAVVALVPDLGAVLTRLAEIEDLDDLGSPLTGAEIMELLGIEPGPDVGRATRMLKERRLEAGPIGPAEAARILRSWWVSGADLSGRQET